MLFLLVVGEAPAPKRPFLVKQATTFLEVLFCGSLFQFNSYSDCWRRCRRVLLDSSLGFCDCRRSSFHVVGKVLVIVVRIVVVEIKTLRRVILWFMDFGDATHENFTAEILDFLVLFVCW